MSDTETHDRIGITVTCTVCRKQKKPHGRSGPMVMSFCEPNHFGEQDGCAGYDQPPLVGDLWPGETCADFGFTHCHDGTRQIARIPLVETPACACELSYGLDPALTVHGPEFCEERRGNSYRRIYADGAAPDGLLAAIPEPEAR